MLHDLLSGEGVTTGCVRDVRLPEAAVANAGHAPQVLAAMRNTALTVLRRRGFKLSNRS